MRGKFSYYVIWWIALGVLAEVAFAFQPKCPEHMSGLLVHPRDCDKFLRCVNGSTHVMVCDPGTVFNPMERTCGAPSNVPGCEVREAIVPAVNQYTSGIIQPGAGYSEDLQQVTPQRCYNITDSTSSEQQGFVQLSTSISFAELEDTLGVSVDINGKIGMFSASAQANYLRSLQDKDYAMSFNYYHYVTSNVVVQIGGSGDDALSVPGKSFYNNSRNPLFGLMCGDYYISSYQQGALLTMGLNIELTSSSAKKEFYEKAGAKFGSIVSASESVKKVGANNRIAGSVTIQAFQIGGEPTQLSKILNKDSTGNYYALSCNLQAMDNCIRTASGLLDYATENFPNQTSFKDNKGVTPLGIGFTRYDPIERLGLTPSKSLVTQEVLQYRQELSSKLKENQYYQQKFYPFFNGGYSLKLADTFIDNATSILSKANSNVRILMKQHDGAADCFNFPERCKSIKAAIDSQLQNIIISDLKFVKHIKYTVPVEDGLLYNIGISSKSWDVILNSRKHVLIHEVRITDETLKYYIFSWYPGGSDDLTEEFDYNGNWDSSTMKYVGRLYTEKGYRPREFKDNVTQMRYLSPFFFEAYSTIQIGAYNDPNTVYQVVNFD